MSKYSAYNNEALNEAVAAYERAVEHEMVELVWDGWSPPEAKYEAQRIIRERKQRQKETA